MHEFICLMKSGRLVLSFLTLTLLTACTCQVSANDPRSRLDFDIVVYGGTSGGVMAAVQAKRMGNSVILIEPSKHLGGLSSGGLGATDIGNKRAIGGLSREFYREVKRHYDQAESWHQEKPDAYVNRRHNNQEDAMWFFEPHVAEQIFEAFILKYQVPVLKSERLVLKTGVRIDEGKIRSILLESGKEIFGKIFIDATYEGDLMATAGVKYAVGREANELYQETLNGVQVGQATKHQLRKGISPYRIKGDANSGLLPGIDPTGPGTEGEGDHRVQAYCFRMCVTDIKENQIPFEKPNDYDESNYEVLFRNFEQGEKNAPWHPLMMPNRKTDANNNHGFSTDYLGESYAWPDADYATREAIYQKHLSYQKGLMWTLANHPRVPEAIRKELSRWGNCRDEFPENGGWSHQVYVREARRMVGEYVMTQHNCQGKVVAEDSIGLAAYTMDSHNVQRYVDENGEVRNEGDVQVGGFPPYPISYRSILPKRQECENLLVPVALSASHISYGSIRMEPVFMVLGESAATAASLSLTKGVALHDLDYKAFKEELEKSGQILSWTDNSPRTVSIPPEKLEGIVVDDDKATLVGDWVSSTSIGPFVGRRYLHDGNDRTAEKSITFEAKIEKDGEYRILLAYTANENRSSQVQIRAYLNEEHALYRLSQRTPPPVDGAFVSLGKPQKMKAGDVVKVEISNSGSDGYVVADAIWISPWANK